MWVSTSEVRRMRPLSLGSKANAITRWRIQPWELRCKKRADICHIPHQRTCVAEDCFLGGSGRGAEAQTRPAVPKMPRAPSVFPFSGRLRRQAINLWGGLELVGTAPWGQRYIQRWATTDRTARHDTASRNVTQTLEGVFANVSL